MKGRMWRDSCWKTKMRSWCTAVFWCPTEIFAQSRARLCLPWHDVPHTLCFLRPGYVFRADEVETHLTADFFSIGWIVGRKENERSQIVSYVWIARFGVSILCVETSRKKKINRNRNIKEDAIMKQTPKRIAWCRSADLVNSGPKKDRRTVWTLAKYHPIILLAM